MACLEKLDELPLDARIAGILSIIKVVHLAMEERIFREQFDDAEWRAAGSENIHAAVIVTLHDSRDFRGAADARQALGQGEKHTELGFFFNTGFHHFAVTRFENMQRKLRAGKENDV